MKKIIALILAAAMLCTACCVLAEEAGTKITGNIEDGSFVLTVSLDPEDKGEWRADDTVEDHSVVKLAAAETEDDIFTARYEPAGDGTVTVSLQLEWYDLEYAPEGKTVLFERKSGLPEGE